MSKLIKLCFGLAALASLTALLPATASASNKATVTHPTGTIAPVPLKIISTNRETGGPHIVSRLTDINGNTLAACTTVTLFGTLIKNTHPAVEANITAAHFKGTPGVSPHTEHCEGSFGAVTVTPSTTKSIVNGLPWCLRSTEAMKTDEFQVRGGLCTEAARSIRFILDAAFGVECEYERTTPVVGTYTTHPTHAILHVEKQKFTRIRGGFPCPAEGFLDLTQQVFAETSAGVESPLWIDKVL